MRKAVFVDTVVGKLKVLVCGNEESNFPILTLADLALDRTYLPSFKVCRSPLPNLLGL